MDAARSVEEQQYWSDKGWHAQFAAGRFVSVVRVAHDVLVVRYAYVVRIVGLRML